MPPKLGCPGVPGDTRADCHTCEGAREVTKGPAASVRTLAPEQVVPLESVEVTPGLATERSSRGRAVAQLVP